MPLFKEIEYRFYERFCINVLKCGPIPKHIGFIMHGNRRYARNLNTDVIKGHNKGFEKLIEAFQWGFDLGAQKMTFYAFSIENFKRNEREVNDLMSLFNEGVQQLFDERVNDTSIRFFGKLSLFPDELQRKMAKITLSSQRNGPKVLNFCMGYTSIEEMTNALNEIRICVQKGLILESDITESLVNKFLYTNGCPEPDLIIRTSGEVRLSDFLLWQSSYSVLLFVDTLWPELSIWNLFYAILYYKIKYSSAKNSKQMHEIRRKAIEDKHLNEELKYKSDSEIKAHLLAKSERINNCLLYLKNKRQNQMKEMVYKGLDIEKENK